MEEFVPYILILVSSFPSEPAKVEIERAEMVYGSIEACEAEGREITAHRELYVDERGTAKVWFQCVKSASAYETELAWQELLKKSEADRANGIEKLK